MSSKSRSQITIERKWLKNSKAEVTPATEPGDWILSLGDDWAFLHPVEGYWYFFDSIHGEWVSSGMGVGEAVLLTSAGVTGAKRVPESDGIEATTEQKINRLADWCFLIEGRELRGPISQGEIPNEIDRETKVWNPGFSQWLTREEFRSETAKQFASQSGRMGHRFCTECGTKTHSGDRFCRGCGMAVTE